MHSSILRFLGPYRAHFAAPAGYTYSLSIAMYWAAFSEYIWPVYWLPYYAGHSSILRFLGFYQPHFAAPAGYTYGLSIAMY